MPCLHAESSHILLHGAGRRCRCWNARSLGVNSDNSANSAALLCRSDLAYWTDFRLGGFRRGCSACPVQPLLFLPCHPTLTRVSGRCQHQGTHVGFPKCSSMQEGKVQRPSPSQGGEGSGNRSTHRVSLRAFRPLNSSYTLYGGIGQHWVLHPLADRWPSTSDINKKKKAVCKAVLCKNAQECTKDNTSEA